MQQKRAGSSQAAWALLTEGVTSARVEAHRLRALVSRALLLVEKSTEKEHLHEVAGDLIVAVPRRLEALENDLDRTSYALAVLGKDTLRDQLPLSDRKLVDEAVERAKPMFGPALIRSAKNVAAEYLRRADREPPLGYEGGGCQVVDRIRDLLPPSRLQQQLVDMIEEGDDLSNAEASKVYHPLNERGPEGPFKHIVLTAHMQYRMDLRGISVPEVRSALQGFVKKYLADKSKGPLFVRFLEERFARGEELTWTDPRLDLFVAFRMAGKNIVLITTYRPGDPKPHPPGDGGCDS